MNMMARDMNITRQNIASLTKAMTGKSSRGADALWMNTEKRNKLLSGGSDGPAIRTPTKIGGSTSSILSGVLGGVMGIGGSVGSGIFRALGSIIAISPIVGIVGIAAAGYAIQKMTEQIDFKGMFNSIKNNIMTFLGIDPESDEPILRQLAGKLNKVFSTDKFTSIYDWIDETFREDFQKIKNMIIKGTNVTMAYTEAAFKVLSDGFSRIGEVFSAHFKYFINQYKPEILGTLGGAIGFAVGGMFGLPKAAMLAAMTSTAGYILGKVTKTNLNIEDIRQGMEEERKILSEYEQIEQLKKTNKGLKFEELPSELQTDFNKQYFESRDFQRNKMREISRGKIERAQKDYGVAMEALEKMRLFREEDGVNFKNNFLNYYEEAIKKYENKSSSPSQVSNKEMAQFIYGKFRDAGYEDAQARAAVANAIAESGLNPNEIARNGEDSYGLFQINMRDPSVSRFVKKTLGFTENDLLDPEKNVDAKIALMRTRTGDHAKFVKTTDPQKATEDFMKMFSRPTDTSDAAVNKRIGNLTAVNKLLGDTINQGSRELADANRPTAVEKNPVIVNNNNTNVTKTAAPTQPIPNAFNVEISELLFGQLVRGM
jgi:hypothetical protein